MEIKETGKGSKKKKNQKQSCFISDDSADPFLWYVLFCYLPIAGGLPCHFEIIDLTWGSGKVLL